MRSSFPWHLVSIRLRSFQRLIESSHHLFRQSVKTVKYADEDKLKVKLTIRREVAELHRWQLDFESNS